MPDVYLQHGRSKERGFTMPLSPLTSEGGRRVPGYDKPRLTVRTLSCAPRLGLTFVPEHRESPSVGRRPCDPYPDRAFSNHRLIVEESEMTDS